MERSDWSGGYGLGGKVDGVEGEGACMVGGEQVSEAQVGGIMWYRVYVCQVLSPGGVVMGDIASSLLQTQKQPSVISENSIFIVLFAISASTSASA